MTCYMIITEKQKYSEIVDAFNQSTVQYQPLEYSEIHYELPLKCEACAFNMKRKLRKKFGAKIHSVSCQINQRDPKKGRVMVQFKEDQVTTDEISDFIRNEMLDADDRKYFKQTRLKFRVRM